MKMRLNNKSILGQFEHGKSINEKESKYYNSKDGTIINTPKNNKYIKKIEKTNRIHIPIINNTKLLKENNLLTERKTSFEIIHYN